MGNNKWIRAGERNALLSLGCVLKAPACSSSSSKEPETLKRNPGCKASHPNHMILSSILTSTIFSWQLDLQLAAAAVG